MNSETKTASYPVALKRYGWAYIVIACLFLFSNFSRMTESWWSLIPLASILLFGLIGYGMIKGKRIAFTLLYFVSYVTIGLLVMMLLTTKSEIQPFSLIILIAFSLLLMPPLFLVRPYWDSMNDV